MLYLCIFTSDSNYHCFSVLCQVTTDPLDAQWIATGSHWVCGHPRPCLWHASIQYSFLRRKKRVQHHARPKLRYVLVFTYEQVGDMLKQKQSRTWEHLPEIDKSQRCKWYEAASCVLLGGLEIKTPFWFPEILPQSPSRFYWTSSWTPSI